MDRVSRSTNSSKQRATQRRPSLNQSRKDRHPTRIEKPRRRRRHETGTQRRDLPLGDDHIRFQDTALRILRDYRSALNEEMPLGTRPDHAPWKISSLRTPM